MTAKNSLGPFWKGTPLKGYLYFAVFLNVFLVAAILLIRNFLPPVVPLLYGRPEGEGQLIPAIWLISAPLTSLVLTVINVFLTRLVKDEFIRKTLIVSAFLLSILTTVTVVKIIFLVGLF